MARLHAGVVPPRCLPPPFSSSRTKKRTNRLREKLLKTLNRPLRPSPTRLPHNPITTREEGDALQRLLPSKEESAREENDLSTIESSEDERLESSVLQVSSPINDVHGAPQAFSRSFLSLAFPFVGFFILQTFCVIWFLTPVDEKTGEDDARHPSDVKNSISEVVKTKGGDNRAGKSGSELGHMDGIEYGELQQKISMIRAMARDARLMEMKRDGDGGNVEPIKDLPEDAAEPSMDMIARRIENDPIKGEIEELLSELPRLVPSRQKKMPPVATNITGRFRRNSRTNEKDGESNDPRSSQKEDLAKPDAQSPVRRTSRIVRDTPKGFQKRIGEKKIKANADIGGTLKQSGNRHVEVTDSSMSGHEGQVAEMYTPKSSFEAASISSEQRESNSTVNRSGSGNNTSPSGSSRSHGCHEPIRDPAIVSDGTVGKSDPSKLSVSTPPSSEVPQETEVKLKPDISKISMKVRTPLNSRDSSASEHKERLHSEGIKSELPVIKDNRPKENDFWWHRLKYVHVIFLHRGVGDKRSRGLYSLKMHRNIDTVKRPHVIAFEDGHDATNFCSLLESFFRRLGDAYAEVVPLSVTEILKEVKSGAMCVKVVKKRELQLYVGQPLEEVEQQLHFL